MKSAVLKSYEWIHSTLIAGVRLLPISSKTFGPPKGLIPDMQSWISDYKATHPASECWYRKVHDAVNIQYAPARSIENLPPIFVEERTLQQPETFVASIPEPRFLSDSGIIIGPDDRAFEQSCCWRSHFFTRDIEYNTLRRKLKPTILSGNYLTLLSRHSRSYYHWFTECLSRLCIAKSLPSAPILIQNDLRDWQRESLQLLGIGSEQLVELPDGCYQVDQLYFPSFPAYATFTTDWTFSWADWTLNWLREKFCGTTPVNENKRIYISRQGVKHRRVVNEESLMASLEREGFQVVDANPLTIAQKITLFRDAAVIVGAHGAGLTHSLFAPRGATIIEAIDPLHLVGGLYYQMASALGQNYWYLFAENQAVKSGAASHKGFDDLVVPIDTLLRTIEASNSPGKN